MIHFINITIQSKTTDDFRSFLLWADSETMMKYELRGYGSTPGSAADNAYARFNSEDRDMYTTHEEEWV